MSHQQKLFPQKSQEGEEKVEEKTKHVQIWKGAPTGGA